MDEYIVVFVTTSSRDEAVKIARRLVEAEVSPCVNVIPACASIYAWRGAITEDEESLMIIKARRSSFPRVKEIVESLHSYEVPEVIAVPLEQISEKYRSYLDSFYAKPA